MWIAGFVFGMAIGENTGIREAATARRRKWKKREQKNETTAMDALCANVVVAVLSEWDS